MLMAGITITFFTCWTPYVVFNYIYDFRKSLLDGWRKSLVELAYALCLLCGLLTSLANPVLYSVLNEGFRQAVGDLIAKTTKRCGWRSRAGGREQEQRRKENREAAEAVSDADEERALG